jgi:phage major head subunit gpT-like protein
MKMNILTFKKSLSDPQPPSLLSDALKALWYDGKGDWDKAHDIAQEVPGTTGAIIHAYLHRKEGDIYNAQYWYRHAGKHLPSLSLEDEWMELVERFLD